jgi:hypothetical protein
MFFNQTIYSTGATSNPASVAVADVNNDNKPDIVVADYTSNNVGVLFNAGNNTFLPQITYSTGAGSNPRSVAVADVNGDNQPDIVVAEFTSSNIGVFLNVGNGTFLAQTTYSTGGGSTPRAAVVADVNSDNNPDIIVANYGGNTVGVFLNAGNGTFLAQTTYSTGAASNPTSVAVADVNGDNKPDIVVADYTSNYVGVFLNTGNGTFLAQTTYSAGAGSNPRSVAVADVNNDNKPDIVVAEYTTNSFGIFLNAGNGTFLNQATYLISAGSNPRASVVADVNSDNKPDIVVADYSSNYVSVFLNAGNGTFFNQTTYSTGAGSNPYSVVVADVNNDNKPDIVVPNYTSNSVGVFLHC